MAHVKSLEKERWQEIVSKSGEHVKGHGKNDNLMENLGCKRCILYNQDGQDKKIATTIMVTFLISGQVRRHFKFSHNQKKCISKLGTRKELGVIVLEAS